MEILASEQYSKAQKLGLKYLKAAQTAGEDPYPAVLDEIERDYEIVSRVDLGLVDVPIELVAGTRSAGRTAALAGNFMPILDADTEFGAKWIRLCQSHMEEGIRDPITCCEFLGKFYVQEGNKRVSVLKSFDAPTVSANVTRLLPARTGETRIEAYYEFVSFFSRSGLYGVSFDRPGGYTRLQAALGMEEDHVWTETERRSFRAGYARFKEAYARMKVQPAPPAEALLVWLEVFSFNDIKQLPEDLLVDRIAKLWTDMKTQQEQEDPITVAQELPEKDKSLVAKLLGVGQPGHVNAAFIYGFDPKTSVWTRAHDHGREYVEKTLGDKVSVRVYQTEGKDYYGAMEQAAAEGADLIFATTPPMIDACRRLAATFPHVRVFNCALSQPYTGVRMYYSRIYECKFITGAIAGAMAEQDLVGCISGYPIFGEPASINAFALGVRMTNPRARVKLLWSCTRKDSIDAFLRAGISVISNRDAANPEHDHWALEWGTYKLLPDGGMQPLAVPCWNWGALYEKILRSALKGALDSGPSDKAINYWLGLDSGVIDVQLSEALPDGVRSLALLLKEGLKKGEIDPFRCRIFDRDGRCRSEGDRGFTPEELMRMDWLCDNVDGTIPAFDELLPGSREMVRLLGLYRESLSPVMEEKQL